MVLTPPSFTLLMITSFFTGPTEYVPFPDPMTEETCNIEAAEKNTGWKLRGDKTFVKSVHYVCVPKRIVIP